LRTYIDAVESEIESDAEAKIFEGYMSLKPSPFFTVDLGKKTLNWGKGYAWNPVGLLIVVKTLIIQRMPLKDI